MSESTSASESDICREETPQETQLAEEKQGVMGIKKRLRSNRQKLIAVELMRDFGQNTTLHGLRYMTDKGLGLIEKLFWTGTFLISIIWCIYLMRNVWVKWQTSPVIVVLSEHLVSVGEVPFPSVTICPQIKAKRSIYNFTKEMLEKEIKLIQLIHSGLDIDDNIDQPSFHKLEDIGLICEIRQVIKGSLMRAYSDAEVIKNIIEVSPNVSDVFQDCYWRRESLKCDQLFKPVITKEGVCFTMNSLAADEIFRMENIQKNYSYLNASEPSRGWSYSDGYSSTEESVYPARGRGNGDLPDFWFILRELTSDRDGLCNGRNHGFKVYLHHPADMPQTSLYYYTALPKQSSALALKFSVFNTSTNLKNYPPETRQCYFPEERQLKYFRTYTANNCRLECLSNYTYDQCGCVWFHMPHYNSSRICRKAQRKCVENVKEMFANEEGSPNSNVSSCQCLPSCIGIQYDAETINTEYDDDKYIDAVKVFLPDWRRQKEAVYTQIELYYKEPQFMSMYRSELFGPTDFLANCGGLLGLFLGFSFLSIVEIFYFCTFRLGGSLRRGRDRELADNVSNKSEPAVSHM